MVEAHEISTMKGGQLRIYKTVARPYLMHVLDSLGVQVSWTKNSLIIFFFVFP